MDCICFVYQCTKWKVGKVGDAGENWLATSFVSLTLVVTVVSPVIYSQLAVDR